MPNINSPTPDATNSTKGKIQLSGDLSGTASAPTVNGFQSWSSWTPTLTNITLGNGSIIARYVQQGKTVHAYFYMTFGSTSSMGTFPCTFTLPVPASSNIIPATSFTLLVPVLMVVNGTGYDGAIFLDTAGKVTFVVYNASGTYLTDNGVQTGVPAAWTSGSFIRAVFTYEAA